MKDSQMFYIIGMILVVCFIVSDLSLNSIMYIPFTLINFYAWNTISKIELKKELLFTEKYFKYREKTDKK